MLVVKGFIIGIAKVIPGVSGAVLAISLGLYEKGLDAITHFFQNVKQNFKFLCSVGLGVGLAIVLGSKIIAFLLNSYALQVILLFLGLIIGGVPSLFTKIKKYPKKGTHIISFLICFGCVIALSFLPFQLKEQSTNWFIYLFIGFIDAATMVIPGISGTAILMLLGLYEVAIGLFASIDFIANIFLNLTSLIPYGCGLSFGILLVSFFMNYMFSHHEGVTYYGILGFQISAILAILLEVLQYGYSGIQLLLGMFFLILGIWISRYLEEWS